MRTRHARIALLQRTLDLLILRTLLIGESKWHQLSAAMARVLRPAE